MADKHILVFNRSFWPDIEATGQFITELCEGLSGDYKVTVIAGRSYYRHDNFGFAKLYSYESLGRIKILRVRHTRFWKANIAGRIINWLTYGMLGFIASFRVNPGLIIACTDPPFLGIMAMLISKLRRIPFIYNCRDLYPDVALALGKLKKGFTSGLFNYLNKKSLDAASVVVCLGVSMREKIEAKGIGGERIRVIPDWVDTAAIKPIPKDKNILFDKLRIKNKFIIMHSGNMGLSQDFASLLNSVAMIKERGSFGLIFVGDGVAKGFIQEESHRLGLENVLFLPYQPREMLPFSLGLADLHLVALKKGMSGAIVPSKVYGIMACGRPYLAIADLDSEPVRLAREFGCGLWAEPQDTKAISERINWALGHPRELQEMGERGRRLAEQKFGKELIIREWAGLLDEKGF